MATKGQPDHYIQLNAGEKIYILHNDSATHELVVIVNGVDSLEVRSVPKS